MRFFLDFRSHLYLGKKIANKRLQLLYFLLHDQSPFNLHCTMPSASNGSNFYLNQPRLRHTTDVTET